MVSNDSTLRLPGSESSVVEGFKLTGLQGPAAGKTWQSSGDRCSIGSHPSNDVVIDDATVSRFHCEIRLDARGAIVRDLESSNRTVVDGIGVLEGFLRHGSTLRLGRTDLQFSLRGEHVALSLSERTHFGSLVGSSAAMRMAFALLERAAASSATVLIEGETGTGKEGAAEAIHEASVRQSKPFVVVDCGALPPNLLETELFGHEKGAFTGAIGRHVGAFEAASTGTVFLDEIGELPLDLQPKLLRVLEKKEIRRVGSARMEPVDVRVVAATNRDLRGAVNAGTFRSDLYFRLAVVKIALPPLRSRLDDIPLLVEHLLSRLGSASSVGPLTTPEFIARLGASAWPGNVRELRNYLESCLVLQQTAPLGEGAVLEQSWRYADARRRAIEVFERDFVAKLLARHAGKVTEAAQEAGIGRVYLYRLMQRHGIKNE